jgi:hypothetical protein
MRRGGAPATATRPRLTSGRQNEAVEEATTMSQFMVISVPPPKARPFTAAITGFRPVRRDIPPKPEAGRSLLLSVEAACCLLYSVPRISF